MAVKKYKAPKKIKIPIALTEEVYKALQEKAESENRSMSSQVVWMLRNSLGLIENEEA